MIPQQRFPDCADDGAATIPAGRVAWVGVRSASTGELLRRIRVPWHRSASISVRQRALHAGVGVSEARVAASEKGLYSAYTLRSTHRS